MERDIVTVEQEAAALVADANSFDGKIRQLKRDLHANRSMTREAQVTKERAMEEAETLRAFIEEQVQDVGDSRIAGFESVIEVPPLPPCTHFRRRKRKSEAI
jgi:hypothetical protein